MWEMGRGTVMSGTLGLNYEIGNITSHEKDTMFLSGPKVMCCRICKKLIGAQLHDFLRAFGCEWSRNKFVDVFLAFFALELQKGSVC